MGSEPAVDEPQPMRLAEGSGEGADQGQGFGFEENVPLADQRRQAPFTCPFQGHERGLLIDREFQDSSGRGML
jgi:hypothetical protein